MEAVLGKKFYNFDIKRLGSLFPNNLSFSRRLLQKAHDEKWEFGVPNASLDNNGFGRYIVEVTTPVGTLSFVVFSQYLAPENRTDRVIAQAWDVVFALCYGRIDDSFCDALRLQLIKQEGGRYSSRVLSVSRANRSLRMFNKTIVALCKGQQPDDQDIADIGYLYRTTAVYGNGKFGMADYAFLIENTSLDFPFAAQMLAVYLIREFSFYQINHIVAKKTKTVAASLSEHSKMNLGIGNATGLGMAPFLIKHSKPIAHWILCRENAFLDIVDNKDITENTYAQFMKGIELATLFFEQLSIPDQDYTKTNLETVDNLNIFRIKIESLSMSKSNWVGLLKILEELKVNFQTQEVIKSVVLELYPDVSTSHFVNLNHDEHFQLIPQMSLEDLMEIIRSHYDWVDSYDFENSFEDYHFWYYSENKMEPRLGVKDEDMGAENQMNVGIAKAIVNCKKVILSEIDKDIYNVAQFLVKHPEMRSIIKRIQYMGQDKNISDIHINTLNKDVLPLDLLRCKLALLGASKFDPKSDRWVRVTFFQGAPLSTNLEKTNGIELLFPQIKKVAVL